MKDYATAHWGSWRPSDTVSSLDISTHAMIDRGGTTVGCIATKFHEQALHLLRLYLAPAARNQGIGAVVLNRIKQQAEEAGLPVRLRVLVNNPAVRFYLRHGFRTQDRTSDHIYLVYDYIAPASEETPDEDH